MRCKNITRMLSKVINSFLNLVGLHVIKKNTWQHIESLKIDKLHLFKMSSIDTLITKENPVIFDIGSDVGNTVQLYKSIFKNPIIHCFEPNPYSFQMLKNRFRTDYDVICNNVAIGGKIANLPFFIRKMDSKSGLFKLKQDISHWKKSPLFDIREEILSSVQTIDAYCNQNNIDFIDFLKIDTEGNSVGVLKGSNQLIANKKISVIQTEVLMDLYNSETIYEIEKILSPNRYNLFTIFGMGFWPSGKIRGCNLIFVSSEHSVT